MSNVNVFYDGELLYGYHGKILEYDHSRIRMRIKIRFCFGVDSEILEDWFVQSSNDHNICVSQELNFVYHINECIDPIMIDDLEYYLYLTNERTTDDLISYLYTRHPPVLIDCIGVDDKIHTCESHSTVTGCGIKIKHKNIIDDGKRRFSCYKCTY